MDLVESFNIAGIRLRSHFHLDEFTTQALKTFKGSKSFPDFPDPEVSGIGKACTRCETDEVFIEAPLVPAFTRICFYCEYEVSTPHLVVPNSKVGCDPSRAAAEKRVDPEEPGPLFPRVMKPRTGEPSSPSICESDFVDAVVLGAGACVVAMGTPFMLQSQNVGKRTGMKL